MALLDRFRRRRLLGYRRAVQALDRIATALEDQNRLRVAANPAAAARLRAAAPEVDSAITYPSAALTAVAERTRDQVFRQTGRRLDDEQLMDYLQSEDLDAQLAAAQVEWGRG